MKKEERIKKIRKQRRTSRVRNKILKSAQAHPRLSIFRSNQYIYAQIIDDVKGVTIASASESEVADAKLSRMKKASEVGKNIAGKALKKKVKKVVFDKGNFRYHGRVKALAEAARMAGLEF